MVFNIETTSLSYQNTKIKYTKCGNSEFEPPKNKKTPEEISGGPVRPKVI
jgi:hypothetical protein